MTTQTFARTKGERFRAFRMFRMGDYISVETRWGTTCDSSVVGLSDSVRFTNYGSKPTQCRTVKDAQLLLDRWRYAQDKDGYGDEQTWDE